MTAFQINVSDQPTVTGGTNAQENAVVTGLAGGGFVVVWQDSSTDNNTDNSAQGTRIVARLYSADGTPASAEIEITPSSYFDDQTEPSVAAMADGGFVVGFQDADTGTNGSDIFVHRYDAAGTQVSSVDISGGDPDRSSPEVVAFADGGYGVAYIQEESVGGIRDAMVTTYDSSNVLIDTTDIVIASSTNPPDDFEIATLSPLAPFSSSRVLVNSQYASGFLLDTLRTVAPDSNTFTNRNPSIDDGIDFDVAATRSGTIATVATDMDGFGADTSDAIVFSFNTESVFSGPTSLVNTTTSGTQSQAQIGAVEGGAVSHYIVSWLHVDGNTNQILAQRIDAVGNRLGDEFVVASGTATNPIVSNNDLGTLANGDVVSVFTQEDATGNRDVFGTVLGGVDQPFRPFSDLDGSNGFSITAETNIVHDFGEAFDGIGDINGDGFDDVAFGYREASNTPGGWASGQALVVFGTADGFQATYNPSDLDGTNGFILRGDQIWGSLGDSISGAGDFNGDGIDDFIVGAYGELPHPTGQFTDYGDVHIIYGSTSIGSGGDLSVSSLDGTNGVTIQGQNFADLFGDEVVGIGDINGDGFDDVLIGDRYGGPAGSDPLFIDYSGAAFVVFGNSDTSFPTLSISNLNGSNGFRIDGTDFGGLPNPLLDVDRPSFFGDVIDGGGDINGDGIADFLIASQGINFNGERDVGETYVVFGGTGIGSSGSLDLTQLDGSNGFIIRGSFQEHNLGRGASIIGDINNDGFDDVFVANPINVGGFANSGNGYVIFGAAGGFAATMTVDGLDGTNGFLINNDGIGTDLLGVSSSNIGDFNGDGIDDMFIGAPRTDTSNVDGEYGQGVGFIVYGDADIGSNGFFNLSQLFENDLGLIIEGAPGSDLGTTVAAAGDVNGDGLSDVLVGAPTNVTNVNTGTEGLAFLILGRGSDKAVFLQGTSNDEFLFGSAFADSLFGFGGNDILEGGALNDVLNGGADSDTASYLNSNVGVTIDLGGNIASGGHASGDLLVDIENIAGSRFDDTLTGDGGDNAIEGRAGADTLDGGANTAVGDTVSYASSSAGVTVFLDTNTVSGGHATGDTISNFENITGSHHVDYIYGDATANTINGNGEADWLYGGDGTDTMNGGSGADLMFGEGGVDVMYGDEGGDFMWGGADGDTMHGGNGIDWLRGEGGVDMLFGEEGDDILIGGTGDDIMEGGIGTDTFYGEADNDTINGDANGDVAFGQEGDDIINGGSEGDFLFGGTGMDTINGGTENDLMWGDMPGMGDGVEDIFVFEDNWGFDAIYDFELGIDQISMGSVTGLTQFSDLTIYDGGANVTVAFGADAVTLYGVTLAELNANQTDFDFS